MSEVRSVYLHAPFCAHHCFYCDYAVEEGGSEIAPRWAEAVATEWNLLRVEGLARLARRLDTVYLGGGTPSLLGTEGVEAVAELLEIDRAEGGTEWTVEANPEDVTEELLTRWLELGVNRISLGVQSFQDPPLRWLGRLHDGERARKAVRAAMGAGFGSVSLDLLFGLPDSVDRDWEKDLLEVAASGVHHVTLYGLEAEPRTPLGQKVESGAVVLPTDDDAVRPYLQASSLLGDAGYEHYEVSSLAVRGHASRHTLAYWSGRPYLGLGPGAHSFLPPLRRWNLRDWNAYSTMVRSAQLPLAGDEVPDTEGRVLEQVWCALRTRQGFPLRALPPAGEALVERWSRAGWAVLEGASLRLTPEGWLDLDRRALELAELVSA